MFARVFLSAASSTLLFSSTCCLLFTVRLQTHHNTCATYNAPRMPGMPDDLLTTCAYTLLGFLNKVQFKAIIAHSTFFVNGYL